jgi:hypothetical protein
MAAQQNFSDLTDLFASALAASGQLDIADLLPEVAFHNHDRGKAARLGFAGYALTTFVTSAVQMSKS